MRWLRRRRVGKAVEELAFIANHPNDEAVKRVLEMARGATMISEGLFPFVYRPTGRASKEEADFILAAAVYLKRQGMSLAFCESPPIIFIDLNIVSDLLHKYQLMVESASSFWLVRSMVENGFRVAHVRFVDDKLAVETF